MLALSNVRVGMAAEMTVTVTSAMTVGHFVADMPRVYATPYHDPAYGNGVAPRLLAIFRTAL